MRFTWYWLAWILLVVYALTLERDSALFWVFAGTLALLLVLLIFASVLGIVKDAISRLRHDVHERRILTRDATTESPLERSLSDELDRQGIAYLREYPISRMHVDFAFPGAKLAVECDGYRYHHDPAQRKRDAARDACLRRNGWTVLRFPGDRIREDTPGCVREISEHL